MCVMAAAGSQGCKSSQETLSNEMHSFEEETVVRKQSFGFRFERRKREERRLIMQLCARQNCRPDHPHLWNSHNVSSSEGSVGGDGISQPFIRRRT
jgi:hypothetical protein